MTTKATAPTINDVARLAGVSKRTVSRVLNGSADVNEATRRKIKTVIGDLGFSPNAQARGLAARRSYLLGLVYDVPTMFIADIEKGILNVCGDAGYELVVHPCELDSPALIPNIRRFVFRTKVDGVIILPPVSGHTDLASALDEIGCHNVRLTSQLSGEPWQEVVTDYVPAVTTMTDHLVELGHRAIGFISGGRTEVSSMARQAAFVAALARHGLSLPEEFIVDGAFTWESGLRAARELLGGDKRPTALFAANDEMAFAAMSVAAELGLAVPRDLSIVGFDGTRIASFVVPKLSTIRRPTADMSRLATQKLLAAIAGGAAAARDFETMISPEFVPGGSTGRAPDSA